MTAGRAGAAGLLALGLLLAALAAEAVSRLALPDPDGYYVYPPGLHQTFEPDPGIMPGISGVSHFVVDAEGLRGDELGPEHDVRLLAVGGSTTQCLYLDQDEAWPQRVQQLLQERLGPGHRVWVGNAGKAGRRTRDHVLQVRHLLDQIPDVRVVVLLVGANDVMRRLADGARYRPVDPLEPAAARRLLPSAFDRHPQDFALLPPSRTALWALAGRGIEVARALGQRQRVEDVRGEVYRLRRRQREEAAPYLDELPDLGAALGEYQRNLEAIVGLARDHGARSLLMTQPTAYHEALPEEQRRLLWMGWTDAPADATGRRYYSVEALARGFSRFNATLLALCERLDVACVDLAAGVPKDTRALYDDMHFNEAGAETVARSLLEPVAGLVAPRPRRGS